MQNEQKGQPLRRRCSHQLVDRIAISRKFLFVPIANADLTGSDPGGAVSVDVDPFDGCGRPD
jgi:hypothetical protein